MEGVIQRLITGPRVVRTVMCMLIDAGLAVFAVWLAFLLCFLVRAAAIVFNIRMGPPGEFIRFGKNMNQGTQ